MPKKVAIAGVQMNPRIFEKAYNLEKVMQFAGEAHQKGANIVVFPECALTGYCFAGREEAASVSEPVPGPSTAKLQKMCRGMDIVLLIGLVEKAGDRLYNSAVLIGKEGVIGHYRKVHLPYLGLDRFVDRGDIPFKVYDTRFGRLGWAICYDGSFPETIRVLALQGADIVALITNWPEGLERIPKYVVPARAIENIVNYIAVDRVGKERGIRFIGRSKVVDPAGEILAEAGSNREEIIFAEVDLEKARQKHVVVVPGENESDRFKDRRPEFYGVIVET